MSVSEITSATTATSQVESAFGTNVNKQQFLDLLVTQMRNQDPLEPTKNEDFIAQLATFSQLEEQQATNETLSQLLQMQAASLTLGSLAEGAALIGKEVRFADENGELQLGLVEGIAFEPEGVILTVNGEKIPLGSVTAINTPSEASQPTGGTTDPTEPTTTEPVTYEWPNATQEQDPAELAANGGEV